MSFEQLYHATQIQTVATAYFEFVEAWAEKRTNLQVLINDFPELVRQFQNRGQRLYRSDSPLILEDAIPRCRIAIACEAAANTLYALAEIAANFANRASGHQLPSSFNDLLKKIEDGELEPGLAGALGNVSWYRKVREMRTEWTHFSTVFICGASENPDVVVRDYRRPNDKREFQEHAVCKLTDFVAWVKSAITTTDSFGDYLLMKHVLPKLDRAAEFMDQRRDEQGVPVFLVGGSPATYRTTVGEYLCRLGL